MPERIGGSRRGSGRGSGDDAGDDSCRSWRWSVRLVRARPGCSRLRSTRGVRRESRCSVLGRRRRRPSSSPTVPVSRADTLHKLVYEHHTKWVEHRQPPDAAWWLPAGSVVIIDEAGMVDTRLLHTFAEIARRNHWRTILVGDHRQLDPVDAGGMFAELVEHPDVLTAQLDTLHRFDHQWEADASLQLRDRDTDAVEEYEHHGRVHGYADEHAAIDAVVDAAFIGNVEGRDVLVMASTNRVVDQDQRNVDRPTPRQRPARPSRRDRHRWTSLLRWAARRDPSQRPPTHPRPPRRTVGAQRRPLDRARR